MGIDDNQVSRRLRGGEKLFERPIDISTYMPARDAARLEWGGTWPIIAFEGGTLASMRLLLRYEVPHRFEEHTSRLIRHLADSLGGDLGGLKVTTPLESHAAILTFEYSDPYGLAELLGRDGIVVSPRPGTIRVSPHGYNTVDEIEKFIEALRAYIRARA